MFQAVPRSKLSRSVSLQSSSSSISKCHGINLVWEPFAPLGPTAAFHVGCIVRGSLFLHGGITNLKSTVPSNQFYRLDPHTTTWQQIRTPGSPSLSHHACTVADNRYILLIGGWDGKKRCADVNAYDVQEDEWLHMAHSGFPEGAGLSSHTASALNNGEILIIGREGSLRIQRKHGSAFILSGCVDSRKFKYREYCNNVISRSGHTADVISNSVFIIGGRSDNLLEKASGFKPNLQQRCSLLTKLMDLIQSGGHSPMSKLPCGRKNHVTVCDEKCILVFGGETFDGRSREPVGEMFLISLASPTSFYKLNTSALGRAGHVSCVLDDVIICHGGFSGRGLVNSDLYQLRIIT